MLRRRRKAWLLLIPLVVAGPWFVWSAAIDAASLRVYQIPTMSMSPTLAPGDKICVEARTDVPPERGEIWVFFTPGGKIGAKRVIGLPGESIEVAGGRVLVDGRPIDEPYIAGAITYAMPAVRLEPGRYLVLGDNRNLSNDSHNWGPLEGSRFIGRATFRPWPPSRVGGLR